MYLLNGTHNAVYSGQSLDNRGLMWGISFKLIAAKTTIINKALISIMRPLFTCSVYG